MTFYKNHCFFCVNQRSNGKASCQDHDAQALRDYAKKRLSALKMHGKAKVRTSTSGCMGRCAEGPVMVVYPEGVWYRYGSRDDIDEIIESHLIGGNVVHRLVLPNN